MRSRKSALTKPAAAGEAPAVEAETSEPPFTRGERDFARWLVRAVLRRRREQQQQRDAA